MIEYKVISVDMFQTLVDVNSRKHNVFKRILGDLYNKEQNIKEKYPVCLVSDTDCDMVKPFLNHFEFHKLFFIGRTKVL
jgi:Zn-finger domain-containing protein